MSLTRTTSLVLALSVALSSLPVPQARASYAETDCKETIAAEWAQYEKQVTSLKDLQSDLKMAKIAKGGAWVVTVGAVGFTTFAAFFGNLLGSQGSAREFAIKSGLRIAGAVAGGGTLIYMTSSLKDQLSERIAKRESLLDEKKKAIEKLETLCK